MPRRLAPIDARLIGFATAYALSELTLMRMVGPSAGVVYAQIQTSPSAASYRRSVARLTPTTRARLRSHHFPNFAHPLLYAIALRTGGQRLAELVVVPPAIRTFLTVGPCVGAAADIAENVVRLRMLADDDAVTDVSVRTASALAVTKCRSPWCRWPTCRRGTSLSGCSSSGVADGHRADCRADGVLIV